MRVSPRKALLNLGLFGAALLLILYVNLAPSRSTSGAGRKLDWTTVRYTSRAERLPDVRGKCPGLNAESHPALVVAHVKDNGPLRWLDRLHGKYHYCIYHVDRPVSRDREELQVPANKGHEAMAYLTFIIDNYPNIPLAGVVFTHGSRFSWHNDEPTYDNLPLLEALDIPAALEGPGYHNLRCDWSASTCAKDYGSPQNSIETKLNAKTQPWDMRSASDAAFADSLVSIFGGFKRDEQARLGRSDMVKSQCCAQFVVSRDRIYQHSLKEYLALRQWLLEDAPQDDKISGRIMSYLWHILFLRKEVMSESRDSLDLGRLNQLACPSASDCYCKLYGRCNLEGCLDGHCMGQYTIPPDFTLPEDWARMHDKSDEASGGSGGQNAEPAREPDRSGGRAKAQDEGVRKQESNPAKRPNAGGRPEDAEIRKEAQKAEESRKDAEGQQQADDRKKEKAGTVQESDSEGAQGGTRKEAENSRKEADREQAEHWEDDNKPIIM
ncbi:hypothetical protein KC363_g2243 [Hortaea werneckii]|uniref:Uncharacterized protein n=1 Tax=Hortaea werneckii TaxID=91943 RepID=A0A3M7FXK5_HORWE|nr:hypothetical protein KC361_g3144 [Hortaea werneckii]KAI6886191.1 hypothetical protein KC325_g2956 [Hortaea werneckii]KAI6995956.1 hypothetical protein KC359_g3773 [Hortaea werneckii]KAI7084656.1 hypothetical protein KC356_g6526 [Hortaea werneckii]KAI7147558.1 hypothetical protein KC344_g2722 [Hortaea werneckii]